MVSSYTVPGLDPEKGRQVAELLQGRLVALLDLSLTLKHIHWNVVGPNFIGVHQMLDPQVDAVREMADSVAERVAALGHQPLGTPGAVTAGRTWDDYSLNRALTQEHLAALDLVYSGVITDHRGAIATLDELDLVTQDLLIEQSQQLELFQWFVRAHLEDDSGALASQGARTEQGAARQARATATPGT